MLIDNCETYLKESDIYMEEYLSDNPDEPEEILSEESFIKRLQNEEPSTQDSDPVTEYFNYYFYGTFYKKEFRGQHHLNCNDRLIEKDKLIVGNSIEDVLSVFWDTVHSHIRREIEVYTESGADCVRWAAESDLTLNDMVKFVLLKDPNRKKIYRIDEMNSKPDIVVRWREKHIEILLHVYSLSVSNQKLYDLVKKLEAPTEQDRSGATSNKSWQALIRQLKSMHPDLSADSFVWNIWAEAVEAAPAYKRDEILLVPPDFIKHYFKTTNTNDSEILVTTRRGLTCASNIIRAMIVHVAELKKESQSLLNVALNIQERLKTLEVQVESYHEMLLGMNQSLAPVENELSQELAGLVSDVEDLDHM